MAVFLRVVILDEVGVKNFVTGSGAMTYFLIKEEDGAEEEESAAGGCCVLLDFRPAFSCSNFSFISKLGL